jgi:hypothetical protein
MGKTFVGLAIVGAAVLASACESRSDDSAGVSAVSSSLDRAAIRDPVVVTRPPKEVPPEDDSPPSPPQKQLILAPPTEMAQLPADFHQQLAKQGATRLDEARRAAFFDAGAFAAVRGIVVRADEKLVETKDSGWITATAYQLSRMRSWRTELPETVEVWVRGGRGVGAGEATPDFRQQRRTSEAYFDIGQEVLLSLRKAPLFAGDVARLRVQRGAAGTLTTPEAIEAFAQVLDAGLGSKGQVTP